MTERPKVQHWKCCVPYPGTGGSNPPLSANLSVRINTIKWGNPDLSQAHITLTLSL